MDKCTCCKLSEPEYLVSNIGSTEPTLPLCDPCKSLHIFIFGGVVQQIQSGA